WGIGVFAGGICRADGKRRLRRILLGNSSCCGFSVIGACRHVLLRPAFAFGASSCFYEEAKAVSVRVGAVFILPS
ncbi:hypothetical protein ACMYZ5_04145, partial [Bacteroides sp. KG68]|uniref:hypothetical protein n=1 Tax=Bacteroides sp. KG68 TaxID=3397824 RepID=UPI003D99D706